MNNTRSQVCFCIGTITPWLSSPSLRYQNLFVVRDLGNCLQAMRLQAVSTLSSCSHFKALVPLRGPPLFTCHRVFKWKQVSHSICPVPSFYIFILLCSPDGFSLQIELFFAPRVLFKCLTALCRAWEMHLTWRMEKMYPRVDSCSLWVSLHYIFPSEMEKWLQGLFNGTDDALMDVCEWSGSFLII